MRLPSKALLTIIALAATLSLSACEPDCPSPTPDIRSPTATPGAFWPLILTPSPGTAPTIDGTLEFFKSSVNLNIRTGPGTDFQKVGLMSRDERCEVDAHNADSSWVQVYCDQVRQGWVKASFGTLAFIDSNLESLPSPTSLPACLIKGNVGFDSGERIYHLPECPDYGKTIINSAYGERWFCTEADAISAGWRKAYNCP